MAIKQSESNNNNDWLTSPVKLSEIDYKNSSRRFYTFEVLMGMLITGNNCFSTKYLEVASVCR